MSDSSDEDASTPVEYGELSVLPEKSRLKYLKCFDLFNAWRHKKGAKTFSESVILSYFVDLANTMKPSSLWSIYSMLKATLKLKKDVHIETYPKLLAFIKKSSSGHIPNKSKTFTAADISKFLKEAPDSKYLGTKVALIVGISGACRTQELTNLMTQNVEKHSEILVFKIPDTKTKIERNFVVRDEYVEIVKKYQEVRPLKTSTDRFFLGYRKGKCINQPMGPNKIGSLPREIATFLGLKSPEQYTGHCFRRTSATLLADSGADLMTLKRHGGWKSKTVAEGYLKDAIENKHKTCKDDKPPKEQNLLSRGTMEQCRFCGEFSKECISSSNMPYRSEDKTTIVFNNLVVQIDFNDHTLPKTMCLLCHKKLKEMHDFITVVKNAQKSLINVAEQLEVKELDPLETSVVKHECEDSDDDNNVDGDGCQLSNDEDNNHDDIKNDSCDTGIDSLTVSETMIVKETGAAKRKIDISQNNSKKARVTSSESDVHSEIIIDIKQEAIEHIDIKEELIEHIDIKEEVICNIDMKKKVIGNDNDDISDTNNVGISETGTSDKPIGVEDVFNCYFSAW